MNLVVQQLEGGMSTVETSLVESERHSFVPDSLFVCVYVCALVLQYDLSASTFSPDGRVFQVEYAMKAVENSR